MLKKLTHPLFSSAAVAVLSLSILAIPQRSNASMGVIALLGGPGAIPVLEIGGAVTAAGIAIAGGTVLTTGCRDNQPGHSSCGEYQSWWAGFFIFVGGLIILDQNGNYMDMHYSQVSDPVQVKKLGLTDAEVKALSPQGELADINSVQQTIDQQLRAMKDPTRADAAALWQQHAQNGEISPAAMSAVGKISAAVLNGSSTLTPVASH